MSWVTVTWSFPLAPNSGMMSATRSSSRRRPSSNSVHEAAPTMAFVQLKMV
jgi:hypothetical protein